MGKRIKDLTSLSLPINDNDKIIIERSDKSYNANISDILSAKQDVIADLDTIRSGAALGATALQAVPSEYVTETELSAKKYLTSVPSEYVTETELEAKKYLTSVPSEYVTETELAKKQDVISDLDTIRSGAALGATALQSVPDTYVTESELNAKKYLTSVPSEYVTETELSAKKYLTAIPDEYVTETELANKKFAKASELDALEAAVGTGFTSTNTVASAIAAKQTAIDTEVTNRTQAVSDAKTELLGGATTNYNTLGKLENKVKAVDAAAKAAATKISAKTTGHVTVSSSKDKTTSALTYTISENDIASANALTAETKAREDADNTINGKLDVIQGSSAGSINKAVADAKSALLGDAAEEYNTLGKLEDKILTVSRNVTTIQNSVGENTSSKTLSERVNILENKCDKLDSKANVLWVGTSIPAGDIQFSNNGTTQSTTSDLGSNNYPKMVADALGFNLYNNSRGSSFVCFYPSSDDGTSNWAGKQFTEYQNEVYKGYSLSASMAQVEEKFGPNGLNVPDWLLNSFKSYSYESLIIPYIDGTIASCDTVIIDHGYNDRQQILNETSWHKGEGEEMVIGSGRDWLLTLQDPFEKTQTTEGFFQSCWWADENDKETKKYYWKSIIFLCKKIWNVNPRIQIIIGNYFTKKSDIFGGEFGNDRLGEFICLANTAIANWLQVKCVNVANYTGLYNRNLAAGKDYQIFCPDNVHPHSDSSGSSNKIIARIYINQLRGIV